MIARKKWNWSTCKLKIGDLVLDTDEKTPRADWPLVHVTKIDPGRDDTIHVHKVKMKAVEYEKPVGKLVLLEECSTQFN